MDRLKRLKRIVDKRLQRDIQNPDDLKSAYVHLHGVSLAAALIAEKRGENAELCCMAAMLHDLYAYITDSDLNHAELGAKYARKLLTKARLTTEEETEIICHAIACHDNKESVDGPVDEVLKDADVFQHSFNDILKPIRTKDLKRYHALRKEFGLPEETDEGR